MRAEIGKLVAAVDRGDRRSLIAWGAVAGLALIVWAVAALSQEGPRAVPEAGPARAAAGAPVAVAESAVTKLEARNAQLLHAVVVLSEDNDAMRLRVAQLEQRLDTLSGVGELAARLSRVEGDLAHLSSTIPFARTAPMPEEMAPTLPPVAAAAAPAPPVAASPPPLSADISAAPAANGMEAPPTAEPESVQAGKNTDRLIPDDPAPLAQMDSAADTDADPDPVETASIDPAAPFDAHDPDPAMTESDPALATQGSETAAASGNDLAPEGRSAATFGGPPVPPPRPRTVDRTTPPAQVATRTAFGVDLGRFDSIAMLESKWRVLAKKNPGLVKRLTPMIATRDGIIGPETHLVAGPFADASDAAVACAKFKAIGAGCSTTSYSGDRPLGR